MKRSELKKVIQEAVSELLTEHIVNANDTGEKLRYLDKVLPLIVNTYRYMGGFKGIEDPEDIRQELIRLAHKPEIVWKMSKRGNDIVAVTISEKTSVGLKRLAMASTGRKLMASTQGLDDLMRFVKDDLQLQRTYSEVSGKSEALAKRMKAPMIPVKDVIELDLLPGKQITPVDEFHYTRMIHGKEYRKVMIGFPTKYKEKIAALAKKL